MATAETLLTLCLRDAAQRTAQPAPTGEDDFQQMCEEINKLSGTETSELRRRAGLIAPDLARDGAVRLNAFRFSDTLFQTPKPVDGVFFFC